MSSKEKYLNKVHITSDVYAACLQHALTTEKEEVMGLLIGDVDENKRVSYISASVILHRSDKQPDRVEISPEQLRKASLHAEELACKLKKPMRVVGWYHSHPHITVQPSHVDVKTQMIYQLMDPFFVGLIFSVYQKDTGSTGNQVQLTCFQALQVGSEHQRREIEFNIDKTEIQHHNLESIASLPKILTEEEIQKREIEDEKSEENSDIDELAQLHNDALQTLALVDIVSKVAKPLREDLEARLQSVNLQMKNWKKLKRHLREKMKTLEK